MKCLTFVLLSLAVGGHAYAQTPTRSTQGTAGAAGSQIVTQTGSLPLTKVGSATVSGYSSTTVTGGSQLNSSGGVIPNGTRGSNSSTTYGVSVSVPLPEKKGK